MDYSQLAEKMLDIRAQLSHMPAGEALAEACEGEYYALSFLLTKGEKSCPSELKEHMGVTSARIAAMLKHLEKKGWVKRSADRSDERRVIVSLTEEGRAMISERRREALSRITAALTALGEDEAHEYVRLQQKILDSIRHRGNSPRTSAELLSALAR